MFDYKYEKLLDRYEDWEALMKPIPNLKTQRLAEAVDAFDFNHRRITGFALTPVEVAFHARRDQVFSDYATFKTTGKIDGGLARLNAPYKESSEKYNEEFFKQANEFESIRNSKESAGLTHRWGLQYINLLLENVYGMQRALESLFSSVVIESWTAFEALASDLWVIGVDDGPAEVVARLTVASPKSFKQPEDNIRPEKVHELGIDARKNYGLFLRETGKVTFQRLRDIQLYYNLAFGEAAGKKFDEIANGYIFALSAFRNALTHNQGKADKYFIKQIQRFAEFRSIKPNDELALDGELVRKLRDSSVELGIALIKLVNELLPSA